MLAVHVRFLAHRFTATAFNDRQRSEWPPHPARVYSALVDALYDVDALDPSEAEALDTLAEAGAPWIVASEASHRRVMTHFVPVNDASVCERATLTSREIAVLDAEADLDDVSDLSDKERRKLEKKLTKARISLKDEAAKRAHLTGKPPKDRSAPRSLPWERGKQPRTFPAALPYDPLVTYVFDTDAVDVDALRGLLRRVGRVGHSSSPVCCHAEPLDVVPEAAGERQVWHPNPGLASSDDRSLRVALANQRKVLDDLFARDADKPGRTMPYQVVRYGHGAGTELVGHSDRTFGRWVSFAFVEGPGSPRRLPPAHAVVAYAEALRDALAARAGAPALITGLQDHKPSTEPHAAFVGLPFVGHRQSDGALRGLAVVLPNHLDDADTGPLWRAIIDLEDDGENGLVEVALRGEAFFLRRVLDPTTELEALRPNRWATAHGAATCEWGTVTPIALGGACPPFRHPKPAVQREARRQATRLIQRAAARAVTAPHGKPFDPKDVAVELRFGPIMPGAPHASRVPRYQRPGHRQPRRLVHAVLRFPFPLRGPLLLGSGRHLGLGLCLPVHPSKGAR